MIALGIDPGYSGALSVVSKDGAVNIFDMPLVKNKNGLINRKLSVSVDGAALFTLLKGTRLDIAVIEGVHSMPNQGLASTFRFGEGYGVVQGVLAALLSTLSPSVKLIKPPPSVWKLKMGATHDKKKSLSLALQMTEPKYHHYFQRQKDNGRAEALLLAVYGLEALGCEHNFKKQETNSHGHDNQCGIW